MSYLFLSGSASLACGGGRAEVVAGRLLWYSECSSMVQDVGVRWAGLVRACYCDILHLVLRVFIVTRLPPRPWHGFQPPNGFYIWTVILSSCCVSEAVSKVLPFCGPIRLSIVVIQGHITLMVAFFELSVCLLNMLSDDLFFPSLFSDTIDWLVSK